jgi:hypothetical protein
MSIPNINPFPNLTVQGRGTTRQFEQGMEALSQMDRVKQVCALRPMGIHTLASSKMRTVLSPVQMFTLSLQTYFRTFASSACFSIYLNPSFLDHFSSNWILHPCTATEYVDF